MLRPYISRSSRPHPEHRHADLLTELPQLLLGRRAIRIGRDQPRRLLLELEPSRQLGGGGRLSPTPHAPQHGYRQKHTRPQTARTPPRPVLLGLARAPRLGGVGFFPGPLRPPKRNRVKAPPPRQAGATAQA